MRIVRAGLACAIALFSACGVATERTGNLPSGGDATGGGGGTVTSGDATGMGGGTATGGATFADARPREMDAGPAEDGGLDLANIDSGGSDDAVEGPVCPPGPFPAPMVQSTRSVCGNFAFNYTFNEGPTWVASQNAFFFSNYVVRSPTGGDMIKYAPGGECEVFIRDIGCNGLAATRDGNLLAACQQSRSIVRFDLTTKQPTTIVDRYMGTMFDSPNDLVIHSNGTIYFTNPNFELGGRVPGVGLAIFRIDPVGVLSMIAQTPCNGIGLSPDERKLYVLQAGVWDLDSQGVPSNRSNLFTGGDGMAVDCAGNLYVSGTIFSPEGQRLGTYASPGGTNLGFGGADHRILLVVGPDVQVRELRMNLPGLP